MLPWRAAPRQALDLVEAGETADDMFQRVLLAQVGQIETLQQLSPGALVLWIGDFNQTLEGPNYGGSRASRQMLLDALSSLDMNAYNSASQHAAPGMCAIDLICGPASGLRSDPRVGGVNPVDERESDFLTTRGTTSTCRGAYLPIRRLASRHCCPAAFVQQRDFDLVAVLAATSVPGSLGVPPLGYATWAYGFVDDEVVGAGRAALADKPGVAPAAVGGVPPASTSSLP